MGAVVFTYICTLYIFCYIMCSLFVFIDLKLPLVSPPVDDSAILDVHFKRFYHQPPDGFEEIMIEQSLL